MVRKQKGGTLNSIKLEENHHLHRLLSPKKYKQPLKRSKTGYEIEMVVLDSKGKVCPRVPEILKVIKRKFPEVPAKKEIPKHMIEIHSFPRIDVQNTALSLIENTEKVVEVVNSMDCILFPFGTYPGNFKPRVWNDERYSVSAKVLGKERYDYFFSVCQGFHCHYTMPRGVFNPKKGFLRKMKDSRIKQSLLDSYNMLIAMDPALATILQSSPFVGCKYVGKDSRNLMWRGGKKLKYDGMFTKYQQLGALPPYKQTITDLMHSLDRKDKRWRKGLRKVGIDKEIIQKKPKLDFIWNPVKVNKLGTLEQRGMDMNYLRYIIPASFLIKYVLRKIQQDFMLVFPSDIAIDEPFKVEGNVVYIPPQTYVRNTLQCLSFYEGLGNKKILEYCKRFVKFALSMMARDYGPIMKPISEMLEKEKTVSDMIISKVKKMGYSIEEKLPQKLCQELSLKFSSDFLAGMKATKKRIENLD